MRAETAGGLDLCDLENLKIFNGYEIKKERKLSFEAPSSPEDANGDVDDSDGPGTKSKEQGSPTASRNKCGRPANPIPRHKRHSHIKAEYKRRDKIQKCFDSLITLVPALRESSSSKESKSAMLFKTAEYGRRLKAECVATESGKAALQQELESLGTEIQQLQLKLPQHGVKAKVDLEHTAHMDNLYDSYVQTETAKNWKFWLFGFFMQPLYLSYRTVMSGTMSQQEFTQKTHDWIQDTMSLTSLRKGFLTALRKVSTQTSIMTSPGQLEQDARRKPSIHCVQASQQSSPSVPATPVPSPTITPTPPRTPTMQRQRVQESKETHHTSRAGSRSRSNTPPYGESRQRRKSLKSRCEKRTPATDMEAIQPSKMRLSTTSNVVGNVGQTATICGGNTVTCPIVSVQYVPANLITNFGNSPSSATVTLTALLSNPSKQTLTNIPISLSPESKPTSPNVPSTIPVSPTMNTGLAISTPNITTLGSDIDMCTPNTPALSTYLSLSTPNTRTFSTNMSISTPNTHTFSTNRSMSSPNTPPLSTNMAIPSPNTAESNMDDAIITTFIESLISDTQSNTSFVSQPMITCADTRSVSRCLDATMTDAAVVMPEVSRHAPMIDHTHAPMVDHTSQSISSASFLPVDQGSIITNNTLIPHNFLTPTSSFSEAIPVDHDMTAYTPMETSLFGGTTFDLNNFAAFSTAATTVLSDDTVGNSSHCALDNHSLSNDAKDLGIKPHPLNTDEDSLMKMLALDVMDVNSVMNFLDNGQNVNSNIS